MYLLHKERYINVVMAVKYMWEFYRLFEQYT